MPLSLCQAENQNGSRSQLIAARTEEFLLYCRNFTTYRRCNIKRYNLLLCTICIISFLNFLFNSFQATKNIIIHIARLYD